MIITMLCRINELKYKEVINIHTGERLGFVSDIDVDIQDGRAVNLIVPGKLRGFGFFGKSEDYVIPWDTVKKIGEDIILTDYGSGDI